MLEILNEWKCRLARVVAKLTRQQIETNIELQGSRLSLANQNLSKLDLSQLNLQFVNLNGANLSEANPTKAIYSTKTIWPHQDFDPTMAGAKKYDEGDAAFDLSIKYVIPLALRILKWWSQRQ